MTVQKRVSIALLILLVFSSIGFVLYDSPYQIGILVFHCVFAIGLFLGIFFENHIFKTFQISLTFLIGISILFLDHSVFYGYASLCLSLALAINYGWFNDNLILRILVLNVLLFLILCLNVQHITALQIVMFFDMFIGLIIIVFADYFKHAFKNVDEYRKKWQADLLKKELEITRLNKAVDDALLCIKDASKLFDDIKREGINGK